jgi:hypothetical protein
MQGAPSILRAEKVLVVARVLPCGSASSEREAARAALLSPLLRQPALSRRNRKRGDLYD